MLKPMLGALVLTALFAGQTGCSSKVSTEEVEKKVNKTLSAQVGQKVKTKCPGRLEAKKGKSYVCTVAAADGSRTKIRVRMLNDTGKFDFQGTGSGAAEGTGSAQ